MPETRIAKLFKNGGGQAVRLPAGFRFDGNEVYVTRDEPSGDVVLSKWPDASTWQGFFELMDSIEVPEGFMAERPMNAVPMERNLFGGEG